MQQTYPLESDVLSARSGDREAFCQLVRAHAREIYAITTAISGSSLAGEEIAQETFVYAWQALPTLREPSRFAPWLRQIARNRAHDAIRKRVRRRELSGEQLAQLPSDDPSADERIDNARREAAMWEAFQALDEPDREILALFYSEQGSVRTVAEVLEIEAPAARKRLSRARERLQRETLQTLAAALERSAPGLAFVALVASLCAPRAARAAPRSSARIPLFAGAAIALGLPIAAWRCVPERAAPLPSAAAATRTASPSQGASFSPEPPPPPEDPIEISVQLGDWAAPDGMREGRAAIHPQLLWADPMPRTDETRLVLDWVNRSSPSDPVPADLLAQLAPLRSAPPPEDPWAALAALEAERLYVHSLEQAAPAAPDAPPPHISLAAMLDRARHLQTTWPDHPAAIFTDLYAIEALTNPASETYDPAAATATTLRAIEARLDAIPPEHSDLGDDLPPEYHLDAQLLWTLLRSLPNTLEPELLSAADLDLLARLPPSLTGAQFLGSKDEYLLEAALYLDDPERARYWLDRHHASLEPYCSGSTDLVLNGLPPGIDPFALWCKSARSRRDQASSWLAAQGLSEPLTWQAALSAVARQCAEGLSLDAPLTGEAQFDTHWNWTHWSTPSDLSHCIASRSPSTPTPPPGTQVLLKILPP